MTLLDGRADAAPQPVPPEPKPAWRARVVAVCLALVTLAFLQDPGRIAADTKLDLTVDPWGFLGRSLHLWDPEGFFGQLQNQAYGYLWPMGPFFGLGQTLGLPDWVVQRLWWSLLLVTAFLGMYLLVRALQVATGWPQILAGLAYALAVRPQSGLGAISVEIWPMAVAPWVLLPLVRAATRGNVARAAALSALAVLMAGGVNAVAAGAVLPLALWWLLTLEPGPRRRQLLLWWSGMTVLAILWWLIPLLLLGRYSPPFLDWIESASFTTSITDPTTVLRGANHWLAYLGSASAWRAGWILATYPVFVIATGIVAAAGVAGLAMRSLPHRTFLVGGAAAGAVLVGLGHTGVLSGLGSEQIQEFLDGAGAPLRNVHKFDLVLRIPLTIAFGHLLASIWPGKQGPRWRVLVTGVLVTALVVTWWPTATGQITRGRSYDAVPEYWQETADWLDSQSKSGRALVVPGASSAIFTWGRPQDEPLQALGEYPWGVRDAVPLSSAGNIRALDAVERRLEAGQGSPGLAASLNRMGVSYLVVRNDLSPQTQAPYPGRIRQALDASPGINRVRSFGPLVGSVAEENSQVDENLAGLHRAVVVYSVSSSNAPIDLRFALRSADEVIAVDGAPEAALDLADIGLLRPDDTVVLASDLETANLPAAAGVQTDTDRRREINFGYVRDNESATMTAEQEFVQQRLEHDYRISSTSPTTVNDSASLATASSSSPDVDATWRVPRGATPDAAVDQALDSYWRPGDLEAETSYWRIDLPEAVDLNGSLDVAMVRPASAAERQLPVVVTTDAGSSSSAVRTVDTWQAIPVPEGQTRQVTLTFPTDRQEDVGIREVRLPISSQPRLTLATAAPGDGILLSARRGDAGPCLTEGQQTVCSPSLGMFSEDLTGMFRRIELTAPITGNPKLLVAPRDQRGIEDAVQLATSSNSLNASSQRTNALAGSAMAAFDRNVLTAWQARGGDPDPSLTVRLPEPREIRGIRIANRPGLNASSPLGVEVRIGGRVFPGFTDRRGLFRIPATVADEIEVRFTSVNVTRSRSPLGEIPLPLGVSELALIGADDLRVPLNGATRVDLPCGTGPEVRVDGVRVGQTRVSSTLERLWRGDIIPAQLCPDGRLTISEGVHTLDVVSSDEFRPVIFALTPDGATPRVSRLEQPTASEWTATRRVVSLPPATTPRIFDLAENYNEGWRATIGDITLEAVRLEGWRQGFVVPAGTEGALVLEYGPDRVYRGGLLVGLLSALVVLGVALRPPSLRVRPAVASRSLPRMTAAVVGAAVLLTLGPWGLLFSVIAALIIRRRSLAVIAFAGVSLSAGLAAVAGVRPGSAVTVLQGSALATAWAAVLVANWPTAAGARVRRGRAAATAVPPARN